MFDMDIWLNPIQSSFLPLFRVSFRSWLCSSRLRLDELVDVKNRIDELDRSIAAHESEGLMSQYSTTSYHFTK